MEVKKVGFNLLLGNIASVRGLFFFWKMVKRTMVKLLLTDNAFPTDKQLKRDIFLSCCGSTDNVLKEKVRVLRRGVPIVSWTSILIKFEGSSGSDNSFPTDKELKRDIFQSGCRSTDNALEGKKSVAEVLQRGEKYSQSKVKLNLFFSFKTINLSSYETETWMVANLSICLFSLVKRGAGGDLSPPIP